MGFIEELSENDVLRLVVPIGIGIVITIIAVLLRNFTYWRLHRWSAKTDTKWDDILLRSTRFASLLWCFFLGIYAGIEIAVVPASWESPINSVVPILFAVMGIYTGVVIARVFIEWYDVEVAQKTASPLDDMIMSALKRVVPVIALILGTFLVLSMAGVEIPAVWTWLRLHGPELALLTIIGLVLVLAATALLPKVIRRSTLKSAEGQTEEELNKRVDTLSGVLVAAFQAVVIAVICFMMLSEIGLNISPILAGVGVVGIAIGFGAQSLVKDYFAGFFILLEDQIRHGDVVEIAGRGGFVEEITLRYVRLRDYDGNVHYIANGLISTVTNMSRGFAQSVIDVGIAYREDIDEAFDVMRKVASAMRADPAFAPRILDDLEIAGVERWADSAVVLRCRFKVAPLEQWAVRREYLRRLKRAFDERGIEIPFPHLTIYPGALKDGTAPDFRVRQTAPLS